jgi:PKD repeat protein
MHDFKIVQDSLFVGAFEYIEELVFNQAYYTTMRLSQYNLDGVNKWNRDYTYFPTDNFNDPEYGIYDMELTSDGGYIMCGEIYHFDSLSAGSPGQFGYVLKTNCLGFLGDPISEFTYQSNSGLVEFVNEGIQAGSYTWIFGDGDTLVTNEYVDSVSHVYDANGIYIVQLIAHGCNGESDTILKSINVSGISNGYVGDGTLLTLYPNPMSSGESLAFYVGDIPTEDITVEVVNEIGQSVFTGKIESSQTTYIIPLNFASGVYFVSLKNESDRLEVEKLIVK